MTGTPAAEAKCAGAESGVSTVSLVPYGDTLEQRISVLQDAATALDKSGVAS